MTEELILRIQGLYRDDFRVTGFRFGEGEKAACIMGTLRGNEFQQLYVCQQLIARLRVLEEQGCLIPDKQILVIPCGNPYSINVKKRFWTIDNTDINRMFPGYDQGETTQRIADGIFKAISGYQNGIQLASFYMNVRFLPHVRMMKTGYEATDKARSFGLPYVVLHQPRPFDTATLNYNWQIWGARAFSLYTTSTDRVEPESATQGVEAILQFLSREGIIRYNGFPGHISRIVASDDLVTVRSNAAGFFEPVTAPGNRVLRGQIIGRITHPYLGDTLQDVTAPVDGTVFSMSNDPMVYEATSLCKLIPNSTFG
ncbi:MAG: M14 family metallopeptidase [Aristaeellaceae bacterium]